MILDERTEFADATSVGTPNSTTVNVGDIIDSTVARDMGNGQPVYVVIQVTTALTSGGSAIVNFQIASDATTTIATDDTQTIHFRSDDFAVAALSAGEQFVFMLPVAGSQAESQYERYLAFQMRETAGQALTAGNVNAFLTLDPAGWKSYADGSN